MLLKHRGHVPAVFNDAFDLLHEHPMFKDMGCLQIPLEIFHKDTHWLVKAYIPGVAKEDLHVEVEKGAVYITAVRPKPEDKVYLTEIEYGEMKAKVCLTGLAHVKKENLHAKYEAGVLHLTITKDVDDVPYKVEIE